MNIKATLCSIILSRVIEYQFSGIKGLKPLIPAKLTKKFLRLSILAQYLPVVVVSIWVIWNTNTCYVIEASFLELDFWKGAPQRSDPTSAIIGHYRLHSLLFTLETEFINALTLTCITDWSGIEYQVSATRGSIFLLFAMLSKRARAFRPFSDVQYPAGRGENLNNLLLDSVFVIIS